MDRVFYIFIVMLGVVGFSLKSIFIKLSYNSGLDFISVMSLRMFFSLPFFIVAYIFTKKSNVMFNQRKIFIVFLCSLFYFLSSLTDIIGLRYISVALERVILFTIPIFVLIIPLFYKRKKLKKDVLFFSVVSWAGVAFSFSEELFQEGGYSNHVLYGIFLVFISAISYAAFLILSHQGMKESGAINFTAQVMIFNCIYALFLLFYYKGEGGYVYSYTLIHYPLLLAIFSTVLPSFFMIIGVKYCGPDKVSIMNNIGPFLTMLVGFVFLNEVITIYSIVGLIIVLVSVFFINTKI